MSAVPPGLESSLSLGPWAGASTFPTRRSFSSSVAFVLQALGVAVIVSDGFIPMQTLLEHRHAPRSLILLQNEDSDDLFVYVFVFRSCVVNLFLPNVS